MSSTLLACASIGLAHSMKTKQLGGQKKRKPLWRFVTSTFEIFRVSISFALIEKRCEKNERTTRVGVERNFEKYKLRHTGRELQVSETVEN